MKTVKDFLTESEQLNESMFAQNKLTLQVSRKGDGEVSCEVYGNLSKGGNLPDIRLSAGFNRRDPVFVELSFSSGKATTDRELDAMQTINEEIVRECKDLRKALEEIYKAKDNISDSEIKSVLRKHDVRLKIGNMR